MAPSITPFLRGGPAHVDDVTFALRLRAMQLVHGGAILSSPTARPQLVGELRWWSRNQLAWFPAFGEGAEEARLVSFDQVQGAQDSLTFMRRRTPLARLSTIASAGVDDPDDYRVGWQLWLEVVPKRRAFIDAAFARLTARR
jgi:hypothetical protein